MDNRQAKAVKEEIFKMAVYGVSRRVAAPDWQKLRVTIETHPGNKATVKIPRSGGPRYFEIIVKERY